MFGECSSQQGACQHFSNLVPRSKIIKSYTILLKKRTPDKLMGVFLYDCPLYILPECIVLKSKGYMTVLVVKLCDIPSGSQLFKAH
jgi:hypothetical protein